MRKRTTKIQLSQIGAILLALFLVLGSVPLNMGGANNVFADKVDDDPVANTYHVEAEITDVDYFIEVKHQNGVTELINIDDVVDTDVVPENAELRIDYKWVMPTLIDTATGGAIRIETTTGSGVNITDDGVTTHYNNIVVDDLIVELTDAFTFPSEAAAQPGGFLEDGNGGNYGSFAGANGKTVTLTFNDRYLDELNVGGGFTLIYQVNNADDTHQIIETVELPLADGTTQTVELTFGEPNGSAITKKAAKVNDDKFNWEIDINTNLAEVAQADAVLVDNYDSKLNLDKDDVHVYKLNVMTNGTLEEGDEVTTGFTKTVKNATKELKIEFDSAIDSAYRIKYQTKVNETALTTDIATINKNNNKVTFDFKNDATFVGVTANDSVSLYKGKLIDKKAARSAYNADAITWTIKFNEAGLSLAEPTLTDTLPGGLIFDAEALDAFTVNPTNISYETENIVDIATNEVVGFTIKITNPNPLEEKVEFTYTTQIDKSEGSYYYNDTTGRLKFKNTVSYTVGGTEYTASSNAKVDKGTRLTKVGKSFVDYDDEQKYINWEVVINREEVDLGKVVFEDFIGDYQNLVDGSVVVKKIDPTSDSAYDVIGDPSVTIRYAQSGGAEYNGSNMGVTKPLATLTGEDQPPLKYFDVEFNERVTGAYVIKYRTKIVNFAGQSGDLTLDNHAELWYKGWQGDESGNGWGNGGYPGPNPDDWNVIVTDETVTEEIENRFNKYTYDLHVNEEASLISFAGSGIEPHNIDYTDNSMDWLIKIEPLNRTINEPTVVDNFSEGLYIPIPGNSSALAELRNHLYVTRGANSSITETFADSELLTEGENEDYTLEVVASGNKITGFKVKFNINLEDYNYYIAYTNYIDPDVQSPDEGGDYLKYDNTATLKEDNQDDKTAYAKPDLETIDQLEGDKEGGPDALQPNQREMTWTVRVNHMAKNITGPDYDDSYLSSEYDGFNTIVDEIQGYQKIVDGSVKIYTYELDADGNEINEALVTSSVVGDDDSTAAASYQIITETKVVDGVDKEVETLIVKLPKTISKRYKVVYKTERYGIAQTQYDNTAVFNGDKAYKDSITYTKGETHIGKGNAGYGINAGIHFADWKIDINESESDITELTLYDIVSYGAVIKVDSIKLKKQNGDELVFSDWFTLIGPENMTDNDGVWSKYTFIMKDSVDTLQDHLVLEYRTTINKDDLLSNTVTNKIELEGKYNDYVVKDEVTGGSVTFTGSFGTGGGESGGFVLTKVDKANGKALQGVEFKLEKKDANNNNEYVQYMSVGDAQGIMTTNSSGQITELKLSHGEYRITEISPKAHYQNADSQEFKVGTDSNSGFKRFWELKFENERIRKIVVTKQDEDTEKYLSGFKFTLYKIEDDGRHIVAVGTTGGDTDDDDAISEDENKIVFDRYTDAGGTALSPTQYLEPGTYQLVEEYANADEPYLVHDIPPFELADNELTYASGFTKKVLVKNEKDRKLKVKKYSDAEALVDSTVGLTGTTYVVQELINVERDSDGNVIGGTPVAGTEQELVTDEDGNSTTLASVEKGKAYKIYETKAPEGHELDATPRYVEIDKDSPFVTIVRFINKSQRLLVFNKLGVDKITGGDPDSRLAGAQFKLEKKDENGDYQPYDTVNSPYETVADESYEVVLTAGAYRLTEITEPNGYKLSGQVLDREGKVVSNSNFVEFEFTTDKTSASTFVDPTYSYEFSFINELKRKIQVTKKDIDSKEVVAQAGVEFKIYNEGDDVGSVEPADTVVTDENGIATSKVLPKGKYFVIESKAPTGYFGSDVKVPVTIGANDPALVEVDFNNEKKRSIKIRKVDKDEPDKGIPGAKFIVEDAKGNRIQPMDADGNALPESWLVSGDDGYVTLPNLTKGTYYVIEEEAPAGYYADEVARHEVEITDEADVFDVVVANKRITTEETPRPRAINVYKRDAESNQPLMGATFSLRLNGSEVARSTTGSDGYAEFTGLDKAKYTLVEIVAPDGYILDSTPIAVDMTDRLSYSITVDNQQEKEETRTIKVHKFDAKTGKSLSGATFSLTLNGVEIAKKVTDGSGYAEFTGLEAAVYALTETAAPKGYVLDNTPIRVDTTGAEKEFKVEVANEPVELLPVKTHAIKVYKRSSEDSSLLSGAQFRLTKPDGTSVVKTTDGSGAAEFSGLSEGDYLLAEIVAPAGYELNSTQLTITVDDSKEIFVVDVYNEKKEDKPEKETEKKTKKRTTESETTTETETTTTTVTETTTAPEATEVVTEPKQPDKPTYDYDRTPDPKDPNSPDEIVIIGADGTPLGAYKKHTTPDGEVVYISEDGVPLGTTSIVKTGNAFPVQLLTWMALLSILGLFAARHIYRGNFKN